MRMEIDATRIMTRFWLRKWPISHTTATDLHALNCSWRGRSWTKLK